MDSDTTQCISGSVVMAPTVAYTTETPFSIGHDCVLYKGQPVMTFSKRPPCTNDLVEIVVGLNTAHGLGYTAGYRDGITAPRFL